MRALFEGNLAAIGPTRSVASITGSQVAEAFQRALVSSPSIPLLLTATRLRQANLRILNVGERAVSRSICSVSLAEALGPTKFFSFAFAVDSASRTILGADSYVLVAKVHATEREGDEIRQLMPDERQGLLLLNCALKNKHQMDG